MQQIKLQFTTLTSHIRVPTSAVALLLICSVPTMPGKVGLDDPNVGALNGVACFQLWSSPPPAKKHQIEDLSL